MLRCVVASTWMLASNDCVRVYKNQNSHLKKKKKKEIKDVTKG